jgi:hypothetical protein
MFIPEQLHIINLAIQTNEDRSARVYPLSELKAASDIFVKLKALWVKDNFIAGEIDFSTEEKVVILRLIKERKWTATDSEHVFAIIKTLE